MWCPCSPTCHLSNPTGQSTVGHNISGLPPMPAVAVRQFPQYLKHIWAKTTDLHAQWLFRLPMHSSSLHDCQIWVGKWLFGLWDIDGWILKLNVAQTSFNIWLFSCNFWVFKYWQSIYYMKLDPCLQNAKYMLNLWILRFQEFRPEKNFNLSSKVNYLRAFTLTPWHEWLENKCRLMKLYTQGAKKTTTIFLSKELNSKSL